MENRDFWTNFACFGSKNICMKFLDDSALFLLEKLKKTETQNHKIWLKISKYKKKWKTKKLNILPEHPTCDNRYIMSFGLSFSSEKTIHIQLVRASTLR